MSRVVRVSAPAKVNLTLEVLGRRPDGFHDLASVFATVALADDVRVRGARTLDVRLTPGVDAPPGEDLASRAVRAFAAARGRDACAGVRIRKRIPVAAGLGGGSSDAAAVLRALAMLWRVEAADLALAASLGSDVPFFTTGAPYALVTGRGEHVAPLPPPALPLWIALVRAPVRLATAAVFARLGGTAATGRHGTSAAEGVATARLAAAFRDGTVTPALVRECARNGLEAAAESACPWIADARSAARARGVTLLLSGSGPSLFAVADDRAHALRIARALRRAGLRPRALALGMG